MKHKCIICGRRIGRPIKFPAGSIYVCNDTDCRKELAYKINGESIPQVSFSMQDLRDHEAVNERVLQHYEKNISMAYARATDVGEYIWGGQTLGEMYVEALAEVGQMLEKNFIADMPSKDLPTLMGEEFHSEEARKLLDKRLKEG